MSEQVTRNGRNNCKLLLACAGMAGLMLGASYASVPLYDLFCRVTGYGGTTQEADVGADHLGKRMVTVQFDANVARGMPWDFRPVQRELKLRTGETAIAYYRATNNTDRTVIGTATFNVTPLKVGYYFNKIDCFCFTEQVLAPGQSVDMPVQFFVDPEMEDDSNADEVKLITLSYTFFERPPEQAESSTIQVSAVQE
ncbi:MULTISPECIES: cytochrome c oxidase assembly protein [unclassified Minwuia]|jgi:cytochrome c oxidase assembly protein subunit 11|uniref:cytochrome c oxidase assembly protein n=1 Tax=unclassified Minwuia TaxID=2618799 RepID=UPI00247A05C9|nr:MULTISPECIES: cytochrome c oxidase assembly protein [unclassified Minwuia]